MLAPWKESYDQSRQHIKKQWHYFANKDPSSQGYSFPSSYVWMWELDYKESWAQENWCFQTVVLEKTFESPLNCKEIQPVHPKGKQSWILTGRTDTEAETPILWPPDARSGSFEKTWMLGKIECGRRRGWQRMRWGIPIRITADLSIETLQARREWQDILKMMKENNLQPRLLCPARISFKYEGEIKSFSDQQKLREFSTTKPALQQILKDIL